MTTSSISAVPTTAGTMMLDVSETMGDVASTLLVVEAVKCVLDSESWILLTGGVTADDCDDGVSTVDTVEQFIRNTVSPESQHILLPLVQTVQALLLENVIMMMSGSFTSTVHHLISPAVLVLL